MLLPTIYQGRTKYYDLIYAWKNYRAEATKLKQLIKKYKKSPGQDLLEVACGTGQHIKYLKKDFSILGTDISPGMLKLARRKNPGVPFKQADMTRLKLNQQFDVILCLFSSLGCAKTLSGLKQTLQNFSAHLKPGGVVIIEPWISPTNYRVGTTHLTTYHSSDIKIARLVVSKKQGQLSLMDIHYLVAEPNQPVKYFVDRHVMGLFSQANTLKLIRQAGLQARFLKNSLTDKRGLYIGLKK